MVLSACSAGFVSVDNGNESRPDGGKTESIGTEFVEKETSKPEYQPLSEEERRTIVDTLEAFDPDHLYVDMDPEQAASCGGELRDAYDFIGRETDAGAGYVLGFRNSDEDPLNGLSIYSLDDVIEADRWNEDKNIFERVYTFENIHEMHYTESKDILFLIPDEMEESEELRKAFEYSLCDGDEGVRYLKSVKERGVKMSPPENGGYLEAGTMMSRNTSSNLSAVDRIKLISGTWDSNMTKCDITEGFLDEVEAVELAKKQLDVYYKQGVYPYSVQIQYDNLYSYSSELYCYTDTSFDTYAAYLWKITFTKYDNSVENIVYMTESGTILLAWTNNTKFAQTTTLLDFYENVQIRDVLGENKLYTASAVEYMPVASVTIPYPDAEEIKEIKNGALITLRVSGDLENLQALQYTTEHGQGIVLMPLQNNK